MGEVVELFREADLSKEATEAFDRLFEETDVFPRLGLSTGQIFLLQRLCWRLYDGQPLIANSADLIEMKIWAGAKKSSASDTLTKLVDLQLVNGPIVNKRTKVRRLSVNVRVLRKLATGKTTDLWVEKLLTSVEKRPPVSGNTASSKGKTRQLKNTSKKEVEGGDAPDASAATDVADAARRGPLHSASESRYQNSAALEKIFQHWSHLVRSDFVDFLDEHFDKVLTQQQLTDLAMVFGRYDSAVTYTVERVKAEIESLSAGDVGQ